MFFSSVLHLHTSKFPDFAAFMPSMSPDGDATANPFRDKSVGVVAIIYATRGHERGGFQGCVNLPSYIYTLAGSNE